MKEQFGQSLKLVLLAPLLFGVWMLRSFLFYDHPNLPPPFNSPYIRYVANIGLVLFLIWMFRNRSQNPKVMSDGSVGDRYGPATLSALPLALAAVMPAAVLFMAFDSLPATAQTFLRAQVFALSLAVLAVVAAIWLTATLTKGRDEAVSRLVLALVAAALGAGFVVFEPHNLNFDLGRLHGPSGYVWLVIAGLIVSLLLVPVSRARSDKDQRLEPAP